MSLQGTLDTFSLPEILDLVEKARKTGALEVRDPTSRGVLYFAGGRFSAAEAGELSGPADSAEELDARLIDVCFALFRVETGLFEFENDRFPPWPVRGGSEIARVVEQVGQLRRDWLAIEAVLPSLDCRPDVVDDLDGDRVVLDKAGFRVLRSVDGERNVREIARAVGRSVLEVCKVLKDLVEAGAVVVPTDPQRTMVDELVLTADTDVGPLVALEPVLELVSDPHSRLSPPSAPVAASFPRSEVGEGIRPGHDGAQNGYEENGFPELPEVPGLIVPSSPEMLTDADEATPSGLRDYVSEAREAEQFREMPIDVGGAEALDEHEELLAEDDEGEPAPDRGALLRMFSSLRDP